MKKRRTLIITALLIAALALGIGYAALSRELVIGSEANLAPDDTDFDIVFTSASIDKSDFGSASLTGDASNATTAHYTLTGLSAKGDTAIMTFVIKNRTQDVKATLASLSMLPGTLYVGDGTSTTGNPADYFDKDVVITAEDGTVLADNAYTAFDIAAQESVTVTVTVTLKETVSQKLTLTGASIVLNFSGEGGHPVTP
ncbi:MAG: hypothetical protein E7611_02785 [Ruminococcaceae bacterium]|nr:hypothetical protein [Oscillospiraceae bacterium]